MVMNIQLIGSTNNIEDIEEMKRFSYGCGRICYTKKDFEELKKEIVDDKLMNGMVKRGHHSIFEHISLGFYMMGIPKILAMVLNNEKQYATSEKSARYTKMTDIEPAQNEKYEKWMELLIPEIDKVYPPIGNEEKRAENMKKLAQENARYITSVFTPTKMAHTVNLRQFNFLLDEFEKYYEENKNSEDVFKRRLVDNMKEFASQTEKFRVDKLVNQTDRNLSLFNKRNVEAHFGDVYSTKYLMSFAGLAQAHRHRTINYHISEDIKLNAPLGVFIPGIIPDKLTTEWKKDLREISEKDYPQAQLLKVNERGILEDFRSKAFLRMCGHAQWEIMRNTLDTAKKYEQYQKEYGENSLKPKCEQGVTCPEPCVWTGKRALERVV